MTGFHDRFVDPAIHVRIMAELDAIERMHGVEIVLAVESGSRAWRFPSADSDYDVRFLYLQPVERYLAVGTERDVIERPIDAVLDISGWDLRKAFGLLVRSNAVLLEWLGSPIRYRDGGAIPAQLAALAHKAADRTALDYHYDHQARSSFDRIRASGDSARLKTYFYALRSALALLWLRRLGEPPPMDLPSLMAGLALPEQVPAVVAELLAQKVTATEGATTPRIAVLDRLIDDTLATKGRPRDRIGRADVLAQANTLFASIALATRVG